MPVRFIILLTLLFMMPVSQAVAQTPHPLNGRILFSSMQDGSADIFVMDADGSNLEQLTFGEPPVVNNRPSWSPNGRFIAFESTRDGGDYEIYVMDADGGNVTRMTDSPGRDFMVDWSPTGRFLVFSSDRNGSLEIFVMVIADGSTAQLTFGLGAVFPHWSRNGRKIAFSSSGIYGDLYVMNADGSDVTLLVSDSERLLVRPRWSPDGRKIAYGANLDPPFGPSRVMVVNADGTNPVELTTGGAPSWSPDGRQIAFSRLSSPSTRDTYIMNANGSEIRHVLTEGAVWDWRPGHR
jgi:TolB protein